MTPDRIQRRGVEPLLWVLWRVPLPFCVSLLKYRDNLKRAQERATGEDLRSPTKTGLDPQSSRPRGLRLSSINAETYLRLCPRQQLGGSGDRLGWVGLRREKGGGQGARDGQRRGLCVSRSPGLGTAARPPGRRELLYPSVLAAGSSRARGGQSSRGHGDILPPSREDTHHQVRDRKTEAVRAALIQPPGRGAELARNLQPTSGPLGGGRTGKGE